MVLRSAIGGGRAVPDEDDVADGIIKGGSRMRIILEITNLSVIDWLWSSSYKVT